MARKTSKSDDLSSGPGMTPIDNSSPDVSNDAHEPDSTSGRLPAQDEDASAHKTKKAKKAAAGSSRR